MQELGRFAPTNWNSRTIVEITGEKKTDGWFLHAVTGEEWLLQLKFRVAKKSFQRDDLVARLDLKPLNEIHELPVYGSEPRVKCKNLRGPWQEVQLRVHWLHEIDRLEFWKFLSEAVAGFQRFAQRAEQRPEDVMPWKVLGQKWHLSRKGFPPGKRIDWEVEVLEDLCELLAETAQGGQFLWNNQQVVHVCPPGGGEPWATIHTKRQAGIDLSLAGPKGRFALGRIAGLAGNPELQTDRADKDLVKLRFVDASEIAVPEFADFLREHYEAASEKPKRSLERSTR